jgi:hypothetical protein
MNDDRQELRKCAKEAKYVPANHDEPTDLVVTLVETINVLLENITLQQEVIQRLLERK